MDKRTPNRRAPAHMWLGLLTMAASEAFLIMDQELIITWFTPIMWTGYILAMDGWLYKRTGESWLTRHSHEFPFLILASVGIWVLFEAYNFHLQNWYYQNVPELPSLRLLSYFWSFATIIPGVFLTSQVIESIFPEQSGSRQSSPHFGNRNLWFIAGLAMVTLPLCVPTPVARYLFAPVWIGFIFLIDPINERAGAPSFRGMLERRQWSTIAALLIGGFLCGLLWEAWNYQAFLKNGGHWVYTVPEELRIFGLHYGQMPILGMFGFPPFALELYAMYHFLREMIDGRRLIGSVYW